MEPTQFQIDNFDFFKQRIQDETQREGLLNNIWPMVMTSHQQNEITDGQKSHLFVVLQRRWDQLRLQNGGTRKHKRQSKHSRKNSRRVLKSS